MLMRHITYIDPYGGIWPSLISIRRGIDFRRVLQEANALAENIGTVTINISANGKNEDVTEWIHRKAKGIK